jgi:hypothetical protein
MTIGNPVPKLGVVLEEIFCSRKELVMSLEEEGEGIFECKKNKSEML